MNPQQYRVIVIRLRGRKPPCVRCKDENVNFCMKTGFECREFSAYTDMLTIKRIQKRVSGGFDKARPHQWARSIADADGRV